MVIQLLSTYCSDTDPEPLVRWTDAPLVSITLFTCPVRLLLPGIPSIRDYVGKFSAPMPPTDTITPRAQPFSCMSSQS